MDAIDIDSSLSESDSDSVAGVSEDEVEVAGVEESRTRPAKSTRRAARAARTEDVSDEESQDEAPPCDGPVTSWSSIKKKSLKHIFVNDFVLRMKAEHHMNEFQTTRALGLLHTALFFKAIWDREIHFSNGKIDSVDHFEFKDGQMVCDINLFRNHVPSKSGMLATCKKAMEQAAVHGESPPAVQCHSVTQKKNCKFVEKLWNAYLSKLE